MAAVTTPLARSTAAAAAVRSGLMDREATEALGPSGRAGPPQYVRGMTTFERPFGRYFEDLEVGTLTHPRPTFHGDTIYAETRVLDKKESASKADRGIVTVETKGLNQRG